MFAFWQITICFEVKSKAVVYVIWHLHDIRHDYSRRKYDSYVYHKLSNGSFVFFLLYVDEMLIAAKILIDIHMSRKFLGIEI